MQHEFEFERSSPPGAYYQGVHTHRGPPRPPSPSTKPLVLVAPFAGSDDGGILRMNRAPPIWLPPPPPLSSSSSEDGSSVHSFSIEDGPAYVEGYQHGPKSDRLRWGRSTFSPDEVEALDQPYHSATTLPLQSVRHHSNANEREYIQLQQLQSAPYQPVNHDTSSFHRPGISSNESINQIHGEKPKKATSFSTNCSKFLKQSAIALPVVCFAAAAHLVDRSTSDFELLGASLLVFQGIFWPSLILLGIDCICKRGQDDGRSHSIPGCHPFFWIVALSFLSSISLIALLLAIQRLSISVALCLSFSSTVFVILLSSINREKKFVLEPIVACVLGYLAFIVVGLPSMIGGGSHVLETASGVVGALISSASAVPAISILQMLRENGGWRRRDNLIVTSFATCGSVVAIGLIVFMELHMESKVDTVSFLWASAVTMAVVFGTISMMLYAKYATNQRCDDVGHHQIKDVGKKGGCRGTPNFLLRLRLLVFIVACLWEISSHGINHTLPDPYDISGSLLAFVAFLIAVGYESWSLNASQEEKNDATPCQFVAWLFKGKRGRKR